MEQAIAHVRSQPFFQQLDQQLPGAAIYLGGQWLKPLPCRLPSTILLSIPRPSRLPKTAATEDGAFVEVSNAAFDAAFLTAHHFFGEVVRCKTISAFLFARCGRQAKGFLAGAAGAIDALDRSMRPPQVIQPASAQTG